MYTGFGKRAPDPQAVIDTLLRAVNAEATEAADPEAAGPEAKEQDAEMPGATDPEVMGEAGAEPAAEPRGNLMVPTLSHGCQAFFDIDETQSRPGYLCAELGARPGASRSQHRTHPVVVVGKDAAELTRDHGETGGLGSPIDRLSRLDGAKVLLLGVAHVANSLLHIAEARACVPSTCKHGNPLPYHEPRPHDMPRNLTLESPLCCPGFEAAAAALRAGGHVRYAKCGGCLLQLISSARAAVESVADALRFDPTLQLCNNTNCLSCTSTKLLLEKPDAPDAG